MKRLTDLATQLARLYRHGASIGVDFETIADHLCVHVAVKDGELRYKYINLPGQVNRLLPSALSGQVSDSDLLGSELGQSLRHDDRRALGSREPLMLWSPPQKRPDGTLHRVPQIKIGLHDERGLPLGLIDVAPAEGTSSPASAAEVMRLNQALDMVTEVLGLLMRCDDELALLEKVCALLVMRGGYLAAAVVPVDGERRQAGVPLSLAGDRSELALPGAFRLDDPVWETHPVARAAEAGICVVHKEHGLDDRAPWRLACPTTSTQTLVALPLRAEDDVWAVLLLACDGLDTFMPTRAVLLQRMADELSLGIELLRSRQRLAHERQQREIHLRQQLLTSQRLSLATESADVGLWEWDLTQGTVLMDDRMVAQHGLPASTRTLPSVTLHGWVHPQDRPALDEAADSVKLGADSAELTVRTTPPDGRERTLRLRMSPMRADGPGAAVVGILGTTQDVSVDTVRTRQIKDLGAKLRLATQATGLGLWELALADQTVVLDDRACQIHGLRPDQGSIALADWLQWVHPGQRTELLERLRADGRRPGVGQLECVITPPDGRVRRVLINWASQADETGRVAQLVGTQVDVTERRRDEARAAQTHHRLALMAGATGVGHWRYDLQDGFSFDDAMFRLLGATAPPYPAAAWLIEMCLPSRQREALELALITADEQLEVALQWQGLDGVSRHVVWMGTVDRDARRTVTRAEGLCIDVTLQQQVHQARQALPAPLPAANAAPGEPTLASRVSSELRSPLNAMLGFVQLLRHGAQAGPTAPQEDYLRQVEQAGWQLLDLLNDAADLTRIQSGALPPDLQAVPLLELMGELVPLLEQTAAAHRVHLSVPPLGSWPGVIADRRLLRQALLYLASHAVHGTPPGGTVCVEFERRASRVEIRVRHPGASTESACIRQELDAGGLPPPGPLGPSMRLAIARQSVLAMGGQFETRAGPEAGAAFVLTLTAIAAAPARPASPGPAGLPSGQQGADQRHAELRGRILYVEDNPSNVLLVRECLSLRPGVELVTATNVQEGLAAILTERFDLILLDLQLPDGEGYAVLQRLRDRKDGHPTPCIALTASAMLNERDRALAAGFDEFWTKPLLLPEFLAGLDRWLSPRRDGSAPR